jgi:1,4-alpha-glucan branching enzyme
MIRRPYAFLCSSFLIVLATLVIAKQWPRLAAYQNSSFQTTPSEPEHSIDREKFKPEKSKKSFPPVTSIEPSEPQSYIQSSLEQETVQLFQKAKTESSKSPGLPFEPFLGLHDDGKFRVLYSIDLIQKDEVCIIAEFNEWGAKLKPESDCLHPIKQNGKLIPVLEGNFRELKHGSEYLLWINRSTKAIDPMSMALTAEPKELRSIYWKFKEHLGLKPQKTPDYQVILEEDMAHLAAKEKRVFASYQDGKVFNRISALGYNGIKFLPFNPSMSTNDKSSQELDWARRYMIYSLRSLNPEWGTPDDFQGLMRQAQKSNLFIQWDLIAAHYAHDINLETINRRTNDYGLAAWMTADRHSIYFGQASPWNTYYYRFQDPWVRQFLIESILCFIRDYGVSSIRLDATEGGGENGPGIYNTEGGQEFLKQLSFQIRRHFPWLSLNAESFAAPHGLTIKPSKRGWSFDSRNGGDFYNWFRYNALVADSQVDLDQLAEMLRKNWIEKDISRLYYLTNHDQARSFESSGASGSFLFSVYQRFNTKNDFQHWLLPYYAIALFLGNEFIDMPETDLMSTGEYDFKKPLDWGKLNKSKLSTELSKLRKYVASKSVFQFEDRRKDPLYYYSQENKLIALVRADSAGKRMSYAFIHIGSSTLKNVVIPVVSSAPLKQVLSFEAKPMQNFRPIEGMIKIPVLGPGEVMVLEANHD